jgi:hypothetical protein
MMELEFLCWCVSLMILIVISSGAFLAAVADIAKFGGNGDFELLFNSLLLLVCCAVILALKLGLIN